MKTFITCLFLFGIGTSTYADSSATQEMIQSKLTQLEQVDRQIEGLVKQRVQLKAEVAADIERGANSILPREARRSDRSAEETAQQVQSLNQQIEGLEAQRQAILSSLE